MVMPSLYIAFHDDVDRFDEAARHSTNRKKGSVHHRSRPELQLLQKMLDGQTSSGTPLQRMQRLRAKNGSPLPLVE